MSESFNEVSEAFNKSTQRTFTRLGDGLTEYGLTLSAYGKGDKDLSDLVKTGVNLTVKQIQAAGEESIAFSETYFRWAFSLVGIKPLDKNQTTVSSTGAKKT